MWVDMFFPSQLRENTSYPEFQWYIYLLAYFTDDAFLFIAPPLDAFSVGIL